MKIIFLGYRDWAEEVFLKIKKNPKISEVIYCKESSDLDKLDLGLYDVILTCGTSEKLEKKVFSKIEVVGVHCAELDRYSYGTPIQNQILDGIQFTKHRVFRLSFDEESKRAHAHERLYSHEVDLDLSGNMDDILYQMTATSVVLFNMYISDFPNIKWIEWDEEECVIPRRTKANNRLLKENLLKMDTEQLYHFFRGLEFPYPNGYIEDKKGKLFIEKVRFKKK